ncbi:SIR2 family protein [Pseudomonas viridiflava]|uniref:SIR2 family protein n=1 Tax=Pseudomonas viridiflava TaxID=33069 RepID=A0ABU7N1N2_PSEVI|nr:SIR2 family protein [Pseudomonas viridiflava]MEE3934321.1 SIR2 family protein [Pseudomonas viridiflava]MEE4038837.1 SIR2 family protein [Pseudomonas viridiflava]MEE4059068.1 SIR2 family protein [Pseudomonas viridiflava]MEE4167935.1 SIR2 family protein [Pseudomonas viridiflava]
MKLELPGGLTRSQKSILKFFGIIRRSGDGSGGVTEGIRANYVSTNYDNVIETVLDNCLGLDDSYSFYAYRGVTPSLYSGGLPSVIIHDNWIVSNLLKINGGFEIFKEGSEFEFDYRRTRSDAQLRKNPPQLMLASREQDYTQAYFHSMFPKVVRLLQESKVLVIVGYSMPEEDALLRLIIKQFAEDRADGARKIIFYIDICDAGSQLEKLNSVFPHVEGGHGVTVIPFSGPFGEWCASVVKIYKKITG